MVLNSNRKNVAKIAAASSSMAFLILPSYQLNDDVQDGSFVMENVRDGLKSNIWGSDFLGALKTAGISVKKRICTGLNKVITPIISRIPSLQKITSTCKKLWSFSGDENLIRIVKFIPEYLRKPNNKNKRIWASEKQLITEEDAEEILERIKAAIREKHLVALSPKDWSVYVSLCEEDPNTWIKDRLTENEVKEVIREIALYGDVSCLENILSKIDSNFKLLFKYLRTEILEHAAGEVQDEIFILSRGTADQLNNGVRISERLQRLTEIILNTPIVD